jgi:hypothetical protein
MSDRYCYLLASKQITVSDDGRKDRPKHIKCLSKINKLEKLVHLVGFAIEIYYDAWLYKCQPCIIIFIISYFVLGTDMNKVFDVLTSIVSFLWAPSTLKVWLTV